MENKDPNKRPTRTRKPSPTHQAVVEHRDKKHYRRLLAHLFSDKNFDGNQTEYCILFAVSAPSVHYQMKILAKTEVDPRVHRQMVQGAKKQAQVLRDDSRHTLAIIKPKKLVGEIPEEVWEYATELNEQGKSIAKVSKLVSKRYHVEFTRHRALMNRNGGSRFRPMGRKPAVPVEIQKDIRAAIMAIVAANRIMTRKRLLDIVNRVVEGTYIERRLPRGKVTDAMMNRLMQQNQIILTTGRETGTNRMDWVASERFFDYFKSCQEVLVEIRYARENPEFQEHVENSQPILFEDQFLHKLMEYDETGFDMSGKASAKDILTVKGYEVTRYVDKSNAIHVSGMGGHFANGQAAAPFFVFNCGKHVKEEYQKDENGETIVVNFNGEEVRAVFASNEKGSVTTELLLQYLESLGEMIAHASSEQPIICFIDGCPTHVKYEVLVWCAQRHIMVMLKPPNTSHCLQGLDLPGMQFSRLKPLVNANIRQLLANRVADYLDQRKSGPLPRITFRDVVPVIKPAWEQVFGQEELIKRAWEAMGIVPFTRRPYWRLLLKEQGKRSILRGDDEELELDNTRRELFQQLAAEVAPHTPPPAPQQAPKTNNRRTSGNVIREFGHNATCAGNMEVTRQRYLKRKRETEGREQRKAARQEKLIEDRIKRAQGQAAATAKLAQKGLHALTRLELQILLEVTHKQKWTNIKNLKLAVLRESLQGIMGEVGQPV